MALNEIRAIWNRNPSTYELPAGLSEQEREFAYREAKLAMGGTLGSLEVLWANHPNRCADAIWKPYQWTVAAAECGLAVADTQITNDSATARRFLAGRPPADVITKPLGPSGIVQDGESKVAYTRRLDETDLAELDRVSATATTLQLMNLAYAGLDFVVTPGERWVLLEANTCPQIGFLEAATGAPMTAAMADLLSGGHQPWGSPLCSPHRPCPA